MTKVLAVRTAEGHYLEFTTVRAELEDGGTVSVVLDDAVFATVLDVPDKPTPEVAAEPRRNGYRESTTQVISGAGGIQSEEDVRGIG